jgi:hypothetical protein
VNSHGLRLVGVALTAGLVAIAGCGGGGDNNDPTAVDISLSGSGKSAKFTVPSSVKGPLATVSFTNDSKDAADAQLVRVDAGHTSEEALKVISGGEDVPVPLWIHGEGGVGDTQPGATGKATLKLDAGSYFIVNDTVEGGKPPTAQFTVTGGNDGDLPSTAATVTAAPASGGNYQWMADGLKAGSNELTFVSEGGPNTLHHLVAFPLKPDATLEQVQKFFKDEKGPPPFAGKKPDTRSLAVLDGDKSEVATLDFKPGKYAFACFLPDKGGKPVPHIQKGLLQVFDIK